MQSASPGPAELEFLHLGTTSRTRAFRRPSQVPRSRHCRPRSTARKRARPAPSLTFCANRKGRSLSPPRACARALDRRRTDLVRALSLSLDRAESKRKNCVCEFRHTAQQGTVQQRLRARWRRRLRLVAPASERERGGESARGSSGGAKTAEGCSPLRPWSPRLAWRARAACGGERERVSSCKEEEGSRRRGTHLGARDGAQVARRGRLARDGALEDLDGLAERRAGLDPLRARRREGRVSSSRQGERRGRGGRT